jgi:WD40 repeat protein
LLLILAVIYGVSFGSVLDRFYDVNAATFSRDRRNVAMACSDGTVRIRDLSSDRVLDVLRGHGRSVECVAYSPDGRRLASGSEDKRIKIWDLDTGKSLFTLSGHAAAVRALAYSPDGRQLASGSDDRTVRLWDAALAQEGPPFPSQATRIVSVAFHPDGKRLAWAGMRYANEPPAASLETVVWDTVLGRAALRIPGAENCVAFTPDGKRLLTGGKEAKIWDAQTGRELFMLRGHPNPVMEVTVSPDGRWYISVSAYRGKGQPRNVLKIWKDAGGPELQSHHVRVRLANGIVVVPAEKKILGMDSQGILHTWEIP